jgi:hypothetical protein
VELGGDSVTLLGALLLSVLALGAARLFAGLRG